MGDPGTWAADEAEKYLRVRFRRVYRQAQKEIIEKLDEHTKRMNAMDKVKRAQLAAGQITESEYKQWLNGQIFRGKQWQDQVTSIATTLLNANKQANAMIEGKKRAVFGENATFQAYSMEHGAGLDLSFSVYDSATVTRLLDKQPELLPRKVVNGKKDIAWNRRGIANAVTQGIIQGESVDEIAQRIAKQTSSTNMNAMNRYARTAITGAQNAGRIETMHEAQKQDIKVKKEWIATLDSKTRDAHAELDGQVVDVDKPFDSILGKIMYPGDPSAAPGNVYNCRCTLGYVYEEYPAENAQRLAYLEYIDDNGEYHRASHKISDMSYEEWKRIKGRDNQLALEEWRKRNGDGSVLEKPIIKDEGYNREMLRQLTEILEELPEEEVNMYRRGIEDAPKTITDTFPDGSDVSVSCYSPHYDQIFYRTDDEQGWAAVHETTHYRQAHTSVDEDVELTKRVRKRDGTGAVIRDADGRAVYEEVKELVHEHYDSVSSWAAARYSGEKMQEDWNRFLARIGASETTPDDVVESLYVSWIERFMKENEIIYGDYAHFNDIVDGITGGRWEIRVFGGHEPGYFNNMDIAMNEAIADYTTIHALQLKPIEEEMKNMFPNLYDILETGRKKIWIK